METELIPLEGQSVSRWSGGSTREIYIYRPGSSYKQRNFSIRISSATVEEEYSEFTDLPDYARYLTVLEGKIRLQHNGGRLKEIHPFQTTFFDGAAATRSWGKCSDLNVMLAKQESYNAEIKLINSDATINVGTAIDFFYGLAGSFMVEAGDKAFILPKDSLLKIKDCVDKVKLKQQGDAVLLHISLQNL